MTEQLGNVCAQADEPLNRWERIKIAAQRTDVDFNNLLCHIKVETLCEAYKAISGSKALGLDGVSKIEYGQNLEANLQNLEDRIHKGSYKPQSKRQVLIPKANGKTRPIAISCFEDKLVEWVINKILENVYEPIFIRNSFGFRPHKSAHGAIEAGFYSLKGNQRRQVVEIDFANYFNSIPHRKLMKIIGKRITDNRFKGLIGRFLLAGILEQSGNLVEPEAGTPQGSVMSPILANVYLHYVLDEWFIANYASYKNIIVRYADDAVFFFKKEEQAKAFLNALEDRVAKWGLSLNREKTQVISFGKSENHTFNFLGFTFYWGRNGGSHRLLKVKTNKTGLHKKGTEFCQWIKENRNRLSLEEIWEVTAKKLQGHYNYFGFWMNRQKLNHYYQMVIKSLFKWLNRRSQKASYTWAGFQQRLKQMPLPTPPHIRQLKMLGVNPYVR